MAPIGDCGGGSVRLLGPVKWTYFYLYVLLDVFSRYVTRWMVAMRESAELAKRLIEESCKKQCIQPGQLTLRGLHCPTVPRVGTLCVRPACYPEPWNSSRAIK